MNANCNVLGGVWNGITSDSISNSRLVFWH
ncbi:hypothetical protein GGR36_003438 [Niveibacterium umoris]|uniref:Uncharacterized protein n=1 Tax=Niveibacterium umoris TaxID=1193620 RepID=A0A840BQZ6_9RHOO|nr:hypothetical protein [Niveibacterium umoris]